LTPRPDRRKQEAHKNKVEPMKASALAAAVLGFSCLTLPAMAQQFPAHNQIETPGGSEFYKHFDAFYNPATGRVENNGYLNGDVPPQYQFNKCMASQGLPLK
jgi:hypothetical protein